MLETQCEKIKGKLTIDTKSNCEKVKYWLAPVTKGLAVLKAEKLHTSLCISRVDVQLFNMDDILMDWIHPIGNNPV